MASDTLMSLPNCNLQIETAAQPSIMTTMCSKTAHTQHELPPELIDRVIDFLHDEPKALAACSLVASSWTTTSRYHLFSTVKLINDADWAKFGRLVEISPTLVHCIRNITTDTNNSPSAKWIAACASFTSLNQITLFGSIFPPWQSEAAAISSVAHKITTLTLNLAFASGNDFWPIVRMFPNLVSLRPIGTRSVTMVSQLLSSLPCYSPSISSVSVSMAARQERVLELLCKPPYPLTSLSTFDIHDADPEQAPGFQELAETYASQISRLRLHVWSRSHLRASPCLFRSLPSF